MAHTYDTKANLARGANAAGRDLSYTCGAGATLLVLGIVVDGLTARTGGAPTYNGVALTQASTNAQASSGETTVELWYLLNPPTGSSLTIHIPDDNNVYFTAEASSYKAASGYQTQLRTADIGSGTGPDPTGPTHTGLASGDVIVAAIGSGATTWNPSGRTGTQLYDVDDGSYGDGGQYLIKTDTTDTHMDWTFSTSDDWAIVSAVFREVQWKKLAYQADVLPDSLVPYVVGDLIYASTTAALAKLAAAAVNNVLISAGVSTAPAWGKVGLTTHVSGILPVANGGTGGNDAWGTALDPGHKHSALWASDGSPQAVWVDTAGNVGIGKTPTVFLLDVNGVIAGTGIYVTSVNTQAYHFNGGSGKQWRIISTINGSTDGFILFQHTTDNFSSNFTNGLAIDENGSVGVGFTSMGAKFDVNGTIRTNTSLVVNAAAGNYRFTSYQTSGSRRFEHGINDVPESGGNAGSNFFLNRFDDNDVYLGTSIYINRATGQMLLSGQLYVAGLPAYANNAAAIAAGLTAGAFYRTGADPDPVCVVH